MMTVVSGVSRKRQLCDNEKAGGASDMNRQMQAVGGGHLPPYYWPFLFYQADISLTQSDMTCICIYVYIPCSDQYSWGRLAGWCAVTSSCGKQLSPHAFLPTYPPHHPSFLTSPAACLLLLPSTWEFCSDGEEGGDGG